MKREEIIAGESKNVEFKESLPAKSNKYMKTIVAFANGQGGKLVIGVEDDTRKIVGIAQEDAFKIMDAIANAISDSCRPAIIPDIYMQTIDDATIVIVDIEPGRQRPYYIAAEGMQQGVYVRVAGTTRPADEIMVKELLFEGNNRFWDKMVCLGLQANSADIEALCKKMQQVAMRNCQSEEEKALVKTVTAKQLLVWGVLAESNGRLVPTNAYAILTGADALHCTFQCAVFKDNERIVFVDRREFRGPVQDVIEDAYQFVLRNIHLGAVIEGLYRQDVYEIPPAAIRELIINAAVHRSYLDNGNIQVAIFDNRLEITSPGKLPMGQTIEKMRVGYSKVRNEALAMAFSYMHLIERWGTGMLRIAKMVREAGLGELEILGGDTELRFNIYRNQNIKLKVGQTTEQDSIAGQIAGQTTEQDSIAGQIAGQTTEQDSIAGQTTEQDSIAGQTANCDRIELSQEEDVLLKLLQNVQQSSVRELAQQMQISKSAVYRLIQKLNAKNVIERIGTNRKGYWQVKL